MKFMGATKQGLMCPDPFSIDGLEKAPDSLLIALLSSAGCAALLEN